MTYNFQLMCLLKQLPVQQKAVDVLKTVGVNFIKK